MLFSLSHQLLKDDPTLGQKKRGWKDCLNCGRRSSYKIFKFRRRSPLKRAMNLKLKGRIHRASPMRYVDVMWWFVVFGRRRQIRSIMKDVPADSVAQRCVRTMTSWCEQSDGLVFPKSLVSLSKPSSLIIQNVARLPNFSLRFVFWGWCSVCYRWRNANRRGTDTEVWFLLLSTSEPTHFLLLSSRLLSQTPVGASSSDVTRGHLKHFSYTSSSSPQLDPRY